MSNFVSIFSSVDVLLYYVIINVIFVLEIYHHWILCWKICWRFMLITRNSVVRSWWNYTQPCALTIFNIADFIQDGHHSEHKIAAIFMKLNTNMQLYTSAKLIHVNQYWFENPKWLSRHKRINAISLKCGFVQNNCWDLLIAANQLLVWYFSGSYKMVSV